MPNNILTNPNLRDHLLALPSEWQQTLADTPLTQSLDLLTSLLTARLDAGVTIYPAAPFRALSTLTPQDVRVVILGQDPYHGPVQAQGLAFSVPDGLPRPPSLRNIFLQIDHEYPSVRQGAGDGHVPGYRVEPSKIGSHAQGRLDLGPAAPGNDLTSWVKQGVLLLNTCLTVEDGKPASHARAGWEHITDALITRVARDASPKVFMLWGAHAQAKRALITPDSGHLVLMANHPSPLSARRPPIPFLGCGHFESANAWLKQQNLASIRWKL